MNATMLLVSMCNAAAGRPALLAVDPDTGDVRPLPLAGGIGATGICRIGNDVIVAYQSPEANVAILDASTLALRAELPLAGTGDAHSIIPWGNGIAVASTGTDEVVTYDYDGTAFSNRRVVWRASDAQRDTVHVNAIAAVGDTIVATGFGPRSSPNDLWLNARQGFLYDVFRGRFLARSLGHPHSVVHAGGRLYFCESAQRSFRSLDGEIAQLEGYTRGVAFVRPGYAAVGTSERRSTSRSGGQLVAQDDRSFAGAACALHMIDVEAGRYATLPLADFGSEIYEVFSLDSPS